MNDVETICIKIMNDVNDILLTQKDVSMSENDREILIKDQVISYFEKAYNDQDIYLTPKVEVELKAGNYMISLHHPDTGEKIEALDQLVSRFARSQAQDL